MSETPLIVSIETATTACSVALYKGEQLQGYEAVYKEQSHSSMLTGMIKNVVEKAGYKLKELDAVAVSKGPGSYTGLRIGVSTAKGLCFALEKPLLAVNTLESMALQLADKADANTLLCPMIDARRMEVFTAFYNNKLVLTEPVQALIIDENTLTDRLKNNKIIFFGNGSDKYKPLYVTNPNAEFVAEIHPDAKQIGILALGNYRNKQFEDIAYMEPFYLKDFMSTAKK